MAINVTVQDIDAACVAYRRATGDNPRREGIRVALHSFHQLTDEERRNVQLIIDELVPEGYLSRTLEQLTGLKRRT